ncbi:MAG: hypothetical protein A2750_00965 [Candidatus Yanofskybacteria bacterium RIFCSPHIGHO2_01_FULL_45_42]|uniref:Uncharacterized protein n=3 Tax=Candidatus Yanofskyibacteriota TaxID=1752733 RepID=A0A1F8H2K9_9BACT|nr:MAG: hypothetical protein A2750_00965 [Candidatus Yanofskybacteria bacterium RIFCSPHIGHO2_01_FULL_45_42]OGN15484.1 MAG: hypothetical protein A3C81_01155 [Candidatus Yanofskybacteria bacterium RIFCSPHIGHO2_02_FULL_46_19]OGN31853.1 MAG: hypothetical protein A3J01_01700 [Candidatus Yanofskybacteria bacterium RIFCSPLOWO2_02_FULL_45_18]
MGTPKGGNMFDVFMAGILHGSCRESETVKVLRQSFGGRDQYFPLEICRPTAESDGKYRIWEAPQNDVLMITLLLRVENKMGEATVVLSNGRTLRPNVWSARESVFFQTSFRQKDGRIRPLPIKSMRVIRVEESGQVKIVDFSLGQLAYGTRFGIHTLLGMDTLIPFYAGETIAKDTIPSEFKSVGEYIFAGYRLATGKTTYAEFNKAEEDLAVKAKQVELNVAYGERKKQASMQPKTHEMGYSNFAGVVSLFKWQTEALLSVGITTLAEAARLSEDDIVAKTTVKSRKMAGIMVAKIQAAVKLGGQMVERQSAPATAPIGASISVNTMQDILQVVERSRPLSAEELATKRWEAFTDGLKTLRVGKSEKVLSSEKAEEVASVGNFKAILEMGKAGLKKRGLTRGEAEAIQGLAEAVFAKFK